MRRFMNLVLVGLISASVAFGSEVVKLRPHINEAAKANDVDPVLIEAIIRHESAHGKSKAARNKNNLAGIMGRKGQRVFKSKEECIDILAELLAKYKRNGRSNIGSIGKKYAPVNSDWASLVEKHYNAIKNGRYGAL